VPADPLRESATSSSAAHTHTRLLPIRPAQDNHALIVDVPGASGYSFFGVFDGHGGNFVSERSAALILQAVLDTPEWKSGDRSDEKISAALRAGFLAMDRILMATDEVQNRDDHSGSTAVTALVTPDRIFVANAGDSRSILVEDNKAKAMSEDHKPYNEEETRRIVAAGGTVAMKRVNGDLAVSRALGDFVYKRFAGTQEQQQVSAEPEVRVHVRNAAKDQYLVLACDGVWDVVSNEECAAFVLDKAAEGCTSMTDLAGEIIDWCLDKQSKDNMSAIVVAFEAAPSHKVEKAVADKYAAAKRLRDEEKKRAAADGTDGMDDPSGR
jgi:protein phosphatase 1B